MSDLDGVRGVGATDQPGWPIAERVDGTRVVVSGIKRPGSGGAAGGYAQRMFKLLSRAFLAKQAYDWFRGRRRARRA